MGQRGSPPAQAHGQDTTDIHGHRTTRENFSSMRMNGTLFIVFSLLALFWGLKLIAGLVAGPLPPAGVADEAAPTKEDKIQALLSGDFKRQPRKNPVEGAGLLRCMVRDSTGSVASDAQVRVTPCNPAASPVEAEKEYAFFWEGLTKDSGLVEFRTLPAGEFLLLASLDGAHGLARVTVSEGGAFAEAEVSLWPSEPRTGVVTSGGAPLADAQVVPIHAEDFPGDPGLYRFLPVTSGPDGTFSHPLLPAGAWQLLVSAPGLAPKLVTAEEDGTFRAELDGGEKLSGRVVRADGGRPVNNAKVEIQASDRAGESYSVRANGQGYFSFSALRPAGYSLRLTPGELRAEMAVAVSAEPVEARPAATPLSRNMKIDPFTGAAVATDASATPSPGAEAAPQAPPVLQLMAEPSGSIRGRVLEASAEVGVPGVEVALYSGERRNALQIAKSDQAGYYQLKSLAPGSYRLAVLRNGGRVFVAQPEAELVVSAGVQLAGPVLREVASVPLLGQVLDVNGRPVPEAIVKVSIQGYPGEALMVGSDGEGRFEAPGLQGADQVEVWATRLGQESPRFGPVTIGSSGLQDIMLRLPGS